MIQPWMRGVLLIGAAYNFAWAFFIYYSPEAFIRWISAGDQTSNPYLITQSIGIAVVGVLMLLAALSPLKRRWALILSLIAKIAGGFLVYHLILNGNFNKKFLFHLIMNDLIWIIPLSLIINAAYKNPNQSELD